MEEFSRHSEWSPIQWDKTVANAARRWRSWQERSASAPGLDDEPLYRYRSVSGQIAFRAASDLSEADPLRAALKRWVYRLAEQRINHAALTTLSLQRCTPLGLRGAPNAQATSRRQMIASALGDPPMREVWLNLYFEHSKPLSTHVGLLWERRREIARRLGIENPAELESCAPNALDLARDLNRRLAGRMGELEVPTPSEYVHSALGSDCLANWPAHLTPRNLLEFFRGGDLFRSVELKLPRLPRALGAASFRRGLGGLGAAWSEALAPLDQPYVIAHDPYRLQTHTTGSLFANLPLNGAFLRRCLGVSTGQVREAQRRLARLYLIELTAGAFRAQVRSHALDGRSQFAEAHQGLSHSALNLSLPRDSEGVFLRLRAEDEQRWVGMLRAHSWQERLTEEHQEDWFRNPRAIEQLRAQALLPPETQADPEELSTALEGCLRRLEELL